MACDHAAKLQRLEAEFECVKEEAERIGNLLDVLLQVMSNDWHASDPVSRRRQERQRRMAQAHITGVAR